MDGHGAGAAHAQAHGRRIAVVLEVRMLLRLRLLIPVLLLLVMNLDMSVTRQLAEKAEVDVPRDAYANPRRRSTSARRAAHRHCAPHQAAR